MKAKPCAQDAAAASNQAERPLAFIVPVSKKLELVVSGDRHRAVAILIQNVPTTIAEIEACYAMGHGVWSDCRRLAKRWRVWGVFADPAWAEHQIKAGGKRPEGVAFAILGAAA